MIVEESVWRAIGKHYLAIQASLLDKNLNKIFEDELTVEGKNLDLIDYHTEEDGGRSLDQNMDLPWKIR